MRALSSALRKQLETSVLAARRAAESASRAGVEGLAVFDDRRPEHLDGDQAALRNGLRAKWRQLGGDRELLVAECAYEQWHRLLFARFLAENGLLLHPQYKAPVTLTDCQELAAELGEPDAWSVAARFAAEILPGIFRLDDPCVRLRLAPEGRHALEQILESLPLESFLADDALGWVYQFWQRERKDEVNASGRKVGGADVAPVTQLFTENYMVRFLLENSLGAWWASRRPNSPLTKGFDYLRFDDDGRPAAGSFDGWPDSVAEVTVMDPCCGSGHFLVEAFSMLWQMRAEDEQLSPVDAQDAVLSDSLFGLELDPRCVQIAMFAVALQAWKAGGGWRRLPMPSIVCSGIPVKAPAEEWKALAGGDQRLENALTQLHDLFRDADTLGSLINPLRVAAGSARQETLDAVPWAEVGPLLDHVASKETEEPAMAVLGNDATSTARAAALLSRRYTLISTNFPYLGSKGQSQLLVSFLRKNHPLASADLAAAFLDRSIFAVAHGGAVASVSPEGWLFLSTYERFRATGLATYSWPITARLGPGAFTSISGEVVRPCLTVVENTAPTTAATVGFLDVSDRVRTDKPQGLRDTALVTSTIAEVRSNPRAVIGPPLGRHPRLERVAPCYQGLSTGENTRLVRFFWEAPDDARYRYLMGPPNSTALYGGRSTVVQWNSDAAGLRGGGGAVRGRDAWGRPGVLVGRMGGLPATLYRGELFDDGTGVLVPREEELLPAVWAYVSSPAFATDVRQLDTSIKVTNATLAQVPFDVDHWRKVAEAAGPLPEPWSDDPTQWLFEGRPEVSKAPLQVAVARLLGYRWPEQTASDDLDALSDADGIVCLPSVAGEAPAADRVQQILAAAFGEGWSPAKVKELLEQAGSKKNNLADCLRDEFFKQHCAVFGHRPFVWHIWDGQRDGFSALVSYHRLDRKTLEKLTYTYLGQDWVERQRAEAREEVAGAEARLAAALLLQRKLEAILEGEAPYDIYVRWKAMHEQPIGWEPDLNDGVRLNVRPFVEAGVLRAPFNIHWRKDRGKNPDGSERENDIHLTLAAKRDARKRAGRA